MTEEAYNTAVLRLYDRERSDDARGPSLWMERQLYPIQDGRCVLDAFTDADGRMRAAEGIHVDTLTDDDGIGETFEAFLEFVGSPNQSSRTKEKQHVPQTPHHRRPGQWMSGIPSPLPRRRRNPRCRR